MSRLREGGEALEVEVSEWLNDEGRNVVGMLGRQTVDVSAEQDEGHLSSPKIRSSLPRRLPTLSSPKADQGSAPVLDQVHITHSHRAPKLDVPIVQTHHLLNIFSPRSASPTSFPSVRPTAANSPRQWVILGLSGRNRGDRSDKTNGTGCHGGVGPSA